MRDTVSADVVLSIDEANIDTVVIYNGSWYINHIICEYPEVEGINVWNGTGAYILTDNGHYWIEVIDKAGNHDHWKFTISK